MPEWAQWVVILAAGALLAFLAADVIFRVVSRRRWGPPPYPAIQYRSVLGKYHLKCESCGKTFWTDDPWVQDCSKCKGGDA